MRAQIVAGSITRFVLIALCCSPAAVAVESSPSPHERELQRRGVSPDQAGIRRYLRLLNPGDAERRSAEALVAKLGHETYQVRESATQSLIGLPHPPVELLKEAASSSDPETRWRAGSILRMHAARATPVLHSILAVIAEKELTGLTEEILAAFPQLEKPYEIRLGLRALQATAGREDEELLKDALNSKSENIRAAAVEVLPKVLGSEALKPLRRLLAENADSEPVRLAAARAFADAGKRDALSPLVALLESENVSIRTQAAVTLYGFTGKRFGYAAYDSPKSRAAAVQKWQAWLSGPGKTAALNHPLKFPFGESHLNGNLLLAYGYRNKVVEFDAAGKEIWSYDATGAYGAERLPNGNTLIACYAQKEVFEVTRDKKVVWRMKVPSALNARPLPNGNVLIACHTAKEVWEVSRDKTIVWKYQHDSNCYDAHRLPGGNTMISSDKGIVEITPDKKKVWEYTECGRCYGFHPLPNGNIVLASYPGRKVVEITRDKKPVWSHKVSSPFDAFRLPNGNTLISSSSKFLEVNREGKQLWERTGNSYGRARK